VLRSGLVTASFDRFSPQYRGDGNTQGRRSAPSGRNGAEALP
jgi:hypothetical protein